jgi:hypothetical protein
MDGERSRRVKTFEKMMMTMMSKEIKIRRVYFTFVESVQGLLPPHFTEIII